MRTLLSRLLDVILRRRREDRLSAEVQSHLDMLMDEHIARGSELPPSDGSVGRQPVRSGLFALSSDETAPSTDSRVSMVFLRRAEVRKEEPVRRAAGPPWNQDHKLAMAAAIVAGNAFL